MTEEKVYISFREKGTEKPWQLLRTTDPRHFSPRNPAAEPFDPCAVDTRRVPFYLEQLAEKGYETTITQLDSKSRGVYVVHELENIANMLGYKPNKGDCGYTDDLQPPRK